jgi:5'-nucleotidase
MRLLVTNDDGIDAPGLEALLQAARAFGDPIVVAPILVQSGCGHRVTTDAPFRIEHRGAGRFAVDGTPGDCVRAALHSLARDMTWVLAGINAGGNLGADVYHSGTVAAAREAALHGLPAIAFSHYRRRGQDFNWESAGARVMNLLRTLMTQPLPPGAFWNVNLPHLEIGAPEPEIVYCPLDRQPLPLSFKQDGEWLHYDGNYHGRQRDAGGDVEVCFSGKIAVTRLSLG